MKNEIDVYTLPVFWAGYLINGDLDGYTDKEIEEIKEFTSFHGNCIDVDLDNKWFAWSNDAIHLGCDVCHYSFIND
jgi:hypothetical protein